MSKRTHQSGLRRTLLSVCLAAALGSGSAFGAHNDRSQHNPPAPSWGQLHRTNANKATVHKDWRTRPSRVSTRRTTGVGGGPTVVVTSCADSGPDTLREAATNAVDNTIIDMSGLSCPGSTISLTSGAIETSAVDLYLVGPGADTLTIDGGGTDRVLKTPGALGILDLSLANGKANAPGGCILAYGDVRLESSTISGCRVVGDSSGTSSTPYYVGGGIASARNVVLYGSIVSGNEVSVTGGDSGMGGGMYGTYFAVALDGSRIQNNTVTTIDGNARGGGIYSPYGVYLEHADVTGNSVISTNGTAYGGGVSIYSSGPSPLLTGTTGAQPPTGGGGGSNDLFVGSSTISGNTAHSENAWAYGGGISIYGGPGLDLFGSTISGNTASSACDSCWISGGGVTAFGPVNAYYSTISDNQVLLSNSTTTGDSVGGGLYALGVQLFSSTISGNRAEASTTGFGHGGGIYSSYLISANSTVAFNKASTKGGGVLVNDAADWASTIVANNQAPTGADVFGSFTVTGDHNLVMAPDAGITLPADTLSNDPLLLPLHGNGGSTATHALAVCSPAIDAGSNPWALTHDQRGEPFSRSWGANQDIGAFELQPDPDHIFGDGFDPDPCQP